MLKLNWIYTALIALLLSMWGCDKLIYDQHPDGEGGGSGGNAPKVYLSVNHGGAAKLRSSVGDTDNPNDPTINTDTEDYEDWVHDLALFVFDSGTEGELVATYFDEGNNNKISNSFVIELTPGKRDFYFVANMPMDILKAIDNKADLITYMNSLRDLDKELYLGASTNQGFPMSRVYTNQAIDKGGTIYQPAPFKPVVNEVTEDKVLLVRVVAKLEVNLTGEAASIGVKDIYFRNANREFLLTDPADTAPSKYFNDKDNNVSLKKVSDNQYIYYMPEAIIASAKWEVGDDNKPIYNKPINYFTIETKGGETYDIPIISNEQTIGEDYLEKAMGKVGSFKPNYNIKRNDHYKFTIRNLENIEIIYQVNPWEMVERSLYMGYGYNVEVDESGKVTITNTVEACPPHKITLVAKNEAKFNNGEITAEFNNDAPFESASFQLNFDDHTGGDYLEIWYNNHGVEGALPVKIFSK